MTQHQEILQILKQTGKTGMNSWLYRRQFIQLPVRIKELKEKGYLIVSQRNEDTSVNYILLSVSKPIVVSEKPQMIDVPYKKDGYEYLGKVPANQQESFF
jgi:hypothetical protein